MKRFGLIGGMSWESTKEYYRLINERIRYLKGKHYSADCVLCSINFNEIESTIKKGEWERSNELLLEAATILKNSKAEFIAICSNTMHKCIPFIEEKINIPIVHIVDSTSNEIKRKGIRKALLLGTKFTMNEDFNKKRFEMNGINIIIPNEKEQEIIDAVIFDELCKGIINKKKKKRYLDIIMKYCDLNTGVILGCTEIGLLIKKTDINIPVFDTTEIHAKEIAERGIL